MFAADNAPASSPAFEDQPEKGRIDGFDFYRDPLNAMKPKESPEEITKADVAEKPKVMATQRTLLEAGTTWNPNSTPRPGCRGASRCRSARPPGCRRGSTGPRWGS